MNHSDEDINKIWHPFTSLVGVQDPIHIVKAEGVYLHTEDGRKILDAVSSWWVNIHGHGNKVIAEAIYKQALLLEHVIFAGFTHKPAITLSKNILSILPENQSKVFFSDDGSTAVEVGLKMALQFWHNKGIKRNKIIAIDGAYHGDTFGAMSVSGPSAFNAPFSSFLFDVDFIDFPSGHNDEEVIRQFEKLIKGENIAAFIFEPLVQGAGGMRMYSNKTLDILISHAKSKNIICIADEVMTGFGRTGKLFASDYLQNKPDIFCLSKGITGGFLPLGVTTCSQEIVEAFLSDDISRTFFHGHSYTANPIACAAANASFKLLTSAECQANIVRITSKQIEFVTKTKNHPFVSDCRSLGTIVAVELKASETSYFSDLRNKIYPFFIEQDILLRPLGNVIYIMPPYIITNSELSFVHRAIEDFLNQLTEENNQS
ncbi:MAG: adenosylmethionine--8-amino-7-oxononanoate transaminase [Bacteroidetes bacterium]|nr:adenosylmethionine--8-amino-7-oxononanoate transaminase [Bacteroidota bacterium]MDA1119178.1 adenosylmethionine--8-amino-7-oxononanoate transaminase [Bacteroidota bacterium]